MKRLKKYQKFESVDSNLEDIKQIMNDISDSEDIEIYIDEDFETIKIDILPIIRYTDGYVSPLSSTFTVNQTIKLTIQRLNYIYKDYYNFIYQYFNKSARWIKFYVYNDERGLRDYYTVRMDGSGKFPAPQIYRIQIIMIKKKI